MRLCAGGLAATALLGLLTPLAATASPRDRLAMEPASASLAASPFSLNSESSQADWSKSDSSKTDSSKTDSSTTNPSTFEPLRQLRTSSDLGQQLERPVQRLALLDADSPAAMPFPVATPPPVRVGFPITPARRALLNTIRYSEGTWAGGQDIGYRILFGGSLMRSFERHPNLVIRTARYASAAAGAYQFMPFTWSLASRLLGLQAFGPDEQDQAALLLIQRRGALPLADQGRFTPSLAARLAPEWASFPTLRGSSYYGQPVRRFAELKRFYEDNLAQLLGDTPREDSSTLLVGFSSCDRGQLVCRPVEGTGSSL